MNQSKELENLMAQSNINGVVLLKQAGCSAVRMGRLKRGFEETLFCENRRTNMWMKSPVSRF